MGAAAKRAAVLPHSLPPRGLSRKQSAAYGGVSPTLFDRFVKDGHFTKKKTGRRKPKAGTPPIFPALQHIIDHSPAGHLPCNRCDPALHPQQLPISMMTSRAEAVQ